MPLRPACQQQPASKRNGRDRAGRQKYARRPWRYIFTENTVSPSTAIAGPWTCDHHGGALVVAYPLSNRQVLELLAERGIDVSHRTGHG
jgi:hypothetical protein